MYDLNDGKLSVYKKEPYVSEDDAPVDKLIFFEDFYFGYLGVDTKEYYSAKQSNIEIKARVRILQCRNVVTNDVVMIGDELFEVGRVYHGLSKNNVPVTDMTLEKVVAKYDVK